MKMLKCGNLFKIFIFCTTICFMFAAGMAFAGEKEAVEEGPLKVTLAISAFQDVFSLHVVKEKGWDLILSDYLPCLVSEVRVSSMSEKILINGRVRVMYEIRLR